MDRRSPESCVSLIGVLLIQDTQNLHFIILELCRRPEYKDWLRQEIDAHGKMKYQDISDLPMLDSFIKESVRLNPLDMSTSVSQDSYA